MTDETHEPRSTELERVVLGSALIGGSTQGVDLTGDDFYIHSHGWIWNAIKDIERGGGSVDIITVADQLGGRLQEAGGAVGLMNLIDNVPTSLNLGSYAVRLREYTIRRKALAAATRLAQVAHDTDGNIGDDLERHGNAIRELAGQAVPEEKVDTAFEISEKFIHSLTDENLCIPTGFVRWDKAMGGLPRKTLTGIPARPGIGKSALLWQLCRCIASGGYKGLFFSLEMASSELWARAVCGNRGIMWRDVMTRRVDNDVIEAIKGESVALAERFSDRLRMVDARTDTARMWRLAAQYQPDVIFVDHLRHVADPGEERLRLGNISWELKEMAKAFNCSVVVAVQMNRFYDHRDKKEPQLSDIDESGKIEQNCDNIVFMTWTEQENYQVRGTENELISTMAYLWVKKFRAGTACYKLEPIYDLRHQWFDYVAPPTYEDRTV